MVILTTLIQHISENSRQCNKAEKEINVTQIRKEEVNLSLVTDHMFVYVGDLRELLELISEFSNVSRHKINI